MKKAEVQVVVFVVNQAGAMYSETLRWGLDVENIHK